MSSEVMLQCKSRVSNDFASLMVSRYNLRTTGNVHMR